MVSLLAWFDWIGLEMVSELWSFAFVIDGVELYVCYAGLGCRLWGLLYALACSSWLDL